MAVRCCNGWRHPESRSPYKTGPFWTPLGHQSFVPVRKRAMTWRDSHTLPSLPTICCEAHPFAGGTGPKISFEVGGGSCIGKASASSTARHDLSVGIATRFKIQGTDPPLCRLFGILQPETVNPFVARSLTESLQTIRPWLGDDIQKHCIGPKRSIVRTP